MKKIVLLALGLAFIILETSIINKTSLFVVNINFVIIYSVVLGILSDTKSDYFVITAVGLIYDLLISNIFLVNTIWIILVTIAVRTFMDKLYEEKIWSVLIIFIIINVSSVIYSYSINQIFFVNKSLNYLGYIIWQSTILNTIVGMVVYYSLKPVLTHIEKNWW